MDNVKNPSYYNRGKIEVWEFIEDQKLDYHTGNAVKYITRAGFKDPSKEVEDLQKAVAFLERKIKVLNSTNNVNTKIKSFEGYAESLTVNQREFLGEKFNELANILSPIIDEYKHKKTSYLEKQCIKWFYSMLTYSNLLNRETVHPKIMVLYKELHAVGILE